jgi:hypothetical protein
MPVRGSAKAAEGFRRRGASVDAIEADLAILKESTTSMPP